MSNFGRSVINSLSDNRLFDVEAMNPELVSRMARLRRAGELRRRAATVFPFLLTCKAREEEGWADLARRAEAYDGLEMPLTLNELCLIKLGTFNRDLNATLEEAIAHVMACKVRSRST